MIYLDSAATSMLKPESVKYAMMRALDSMASPGRGSYRAAMLAADKVFECRELACRLFHFDKPENVVFTVNATHALNIAIQSTVKRGDKVLISGYEHNSVTRVLHAIGAEVSVAASPLFDSQAAVTAFEKQIKNKNTVIVNHVSNVFGFIQPIEKIAELCRKNRVPLIIDASQSAGIIDIDFNALGAKYIAMPGHKGLLGPQGTGVLLCADKPKPLLFGGTGSDSIDQNMPAYLPDIAEAGTHNVVGIAGLTEGIRYVLNRGADNIGEYEKRHCRHMAKTLGEIDGIEVFAGRSDNQAGVVSFRHASRDPESICEAMGERGIAARCGLHCAPLAHKTAGTLDTGTVRLSFSPFISDDQLFEAERIIKNLLI